MNTSKNPVSNKNPATKNPASNHVKLQGKLSGLILAARNRRKLSQLEAARALYLEGPDKTVGAVISAWERGWRRVILENDKQRVAFSNLLGVSPPDLEKLLQEDEISRKRVGARRAAGRAVLRQYRLDAAQPPSKTAPAPKVVPAPKVEAPKPTPATKVVPATKPAPAPKPAPTKAEPARKLPPEKIREAVLLTLLAGEPELSDSPSTIQALMRVIVRFNAVCETLSSK